MSITNWVEHHGKAFQGVKTLVTGGAGFIGSHLCEALSALGANVIAFDDLSGGDFANVKPFKNVEAVKGSILDSGALERVTKGAKFVFHQAALGSVPRSVEQPRLFHDVNTTGTLNVLEAARAAKVSRVMFAASSSAYGETVELPKTEEIPPQPRSPYAANKVAGEAMMIAYACSYGLDTAALRYFNIFGPRQNANSAYAAVIAAFGKAMLNGKRPMIYGDGEQSRDFTYVDNAVHANLLAARSEKPIGGTVINVGCARQISVNVLAREMGRIIGGGGLDPIYEPERAGDVKHSLAGLSRAKDILGYSPVVDFERGLAETIAWYRAAGVGKPAAAGK